MKFCWLGSNLTLREVLKSWGHSQQAIKKAGLPKNYLEKEIRYQDELELPELLYNKGLINPKFEGPDSPRILKETDRYLALTKPSQIHCHPLSYPENDNVLSYVRSKGKHSFLKVNEGNWDRGLLYRIDFETTGLVVLTNSEEKYKEAREGKLFGKKIYMVLVEGHYKGELKLIDQITTSGKKIKEDWEDGREVQLDILEAHHLISPNRTVLKVCLHEGARHQIRSQLSMAGHPVWGDLMYGAETAGNKFGLHCLSYEIDGEVFEDPHFWFSI
ncbi:MAG: pseudouridine synthase [Halobacteriovoraceae bacterium]|nr:pseudouridine synthase [Halobacteriovoraceae bacterium]